MKQVGDDHARRLGEEGRRRRPGGRSTRTASRPSAEPRAHASSTGSTLGAGAIWRPCCVLLIMRADDRRRASCARCSVRTGAVNDIVSWLCAAAAFFAMAHAFKHGDFVRVTLLLETAAAGGAARASRSARWRSPRSRSPTSPAGRTASPTRAGTSTTSPQGMLPMPIWIPQLELRARLDPAAGRGARRAGHRAARQPAELRRRGRGAPRARRLLRRRLTPRRRIAWTSSSSAASCSS